MKQKTRWRTIVHEYTGGYFAKLVIPITVFDGKKHKYRVQVEEPVKPRVRKK